MTTAHTASLLAGFKAYEAAARVAARDNGYDGIYLQQYGRALRPMPSEPVTIIDMGTGHPPPQRVKGTVSVSNAPPMLTRQVIGQGWQVVQSGKVLASGMDTEQEAKDWIRENER